MIELVDRDPPETSWDAHIERLRREAAALEAKAARHRAEAAALLREAEQSLQGGGQ